MLFAKVAAFVFAVAVTGPAAWFATTHEDSRSSEELSGPTASQLRALSADFDLPLLFPRELPAGFSWADQISVVAGNASDRRHADARTLMYFDPDSDESVTTCIATVETVQACEATPSDVTLRVTGGYAVVVHAWGDTPSQVVDAWRRIDFTPDPFDTTWAH